MTRFFQYLLIALKYLLMQGLVEIILIVLFEYLGIKVLIDFSRANLFIENVQGVAWEISMKTIMFSFIYLPLFIVVSTLLWWRKLKNHLVYSFINVLLSLLLSLIFLLLLRQVDFSAVFNLLIVTLLSSVLILIITKIINSNTPRQPPLLAQVWQQRFCELAILVPELKRNLHQLMSRKYKFHDNDKLYFISFATVHWIDVFVREEYMQI